MRSLSQSINAFLEDIGEVMKGSVADAIAKAVICILGVWALWLTVALPMNGAMQ